MLGHFLRIEENNISHKQSMEIKKGKLNYDQSGRAYPDKPNVKENWDCIWECNGKHYKLVGDDEHKEWEEVDIFNQIIDEVYGEYADSHWTPPSNPKGKLLSDQLFSVVPMEHSKESFINKIKTDDEFSKRWGLQIEERELSESERVQFYYKKHNKGRVGSKTTKFVLDHDNIPTKLITITYNDKTIESYE
jgi:hypothetical protein